MNFAIFMLTLVLSDEKAIDKALYQLYGMIDQLQK